MKFSKYNLIVTKQENNKQFLFNTFNGNCFEIDKRTSDIINSNDINKLNVPEKNNMYKYGIVLDDNYDEDKILSYMHGKAKYQSDLVSSAVLLTWACNLRCTYCFQGHENRVQTMSKEDADRYISFMVSSVTQQKAKNLSILLFGGEPLVNADIGFYILETLNVFSKENDINFTSSIVTNGTLITTEILEKLERYNCQMIQITLDGVKSIHDSRRIYSNGNGSFDETLNALKLIKEVAKINTVIRINIDKGNLHDTYELLRYIGKNELDLTRFTVDFGIVRDEGACLGNSSTCFVEHEIGDVLYALWDFAESQGFKFKIHPTRKSIYCGLYSDSQYTIAPNCDVYKCWEHVGQKEHIVGKINEEGKLSDIRYTLYDWMSVDPQKNEECKSCVYLPNCGGGCGVISYNKNKTYHSPGCFKVKGTVEKQLMKYIEKLAKGKVAPNETIAL